MISTQVITDPGEFTALQGEWQELLADSPCDCLFLTWEWLHTWWEQLAGDRSLHLVTVREDGRLIAIAPLALRPPRLRRLIPFPVLEFLASDNVGSDYLSFIVRNGHEQHALDGIAEALGEASHMLELLRVDKTSMTMMSALMRLHDSGWRTTAGTTNYAPYVKLAGLTQEGYEGRIHSDHQRDLRVKFKRLHRDFEVRLDLARSDEERRVTMESFVELHLARWEDRGGSTALGRQKLVDFHERISQIALERGWLKLFTLRLDGNPAAQLYMFFYAGVYYYYQTALNMEYQRYSTGMLLTKLAIDDAIANGALEFDFLHDDEEYKYLWAERERELIRLEILPPRAARPLYGPVMQARASVRKLRARVVPSNGH